jgi:chalcone isomerase-like protein
MAFRFLLVFLLSGIAHAAELEGVKLEDRVRVDGQELQLNGIALRTRYQFFKVYVAGLYLPQKATTAQAAIDGRGPKRISITMVRDANADQFVESIDYGVRANSSEAQIASIKPQLDALYGKIRAVKEARKGMRIVLDYAPSAGGTTLFVDGAAQGGPMAGEAFNRALLRIWLGDKPAQDDLKRALLGG